MDDRGLADVLERAYGWQVVHLAYLKQAWVAHCYAVDCAGGRRFFLKHYEQERQARLYARDLEFYLSLCDQLAHKQLLPAVARPVPTTNGQFALSLDGGLLILFHWIEGQTVGFERLADDVLCKAATAVGKLHASTPQIKWTDPPRERFDLPFERGLRHSLDLLPRITSADSAGKQGLRELLLPRRDEIVHLLGRLRELQARARSVDVEPVICHTDLHGGNMMLDGQGVLHLVDWEGAWLAPPEHDLFFFEWDERFETHFLPHYQDAYRPVRPKGELFAFYHTRRNMEDLAEWVVRILYENNGDDQDREDLEGIVEDCISGWPTLA
jgi:Ser/Thr protein kinase RdoA (MazF antagonist)